MSLFDDLESDLAAAFVDPDVMGGEQITYLPYPQQTQAAVVMNAIVRRFVGEMEGVVERVPVQHVEIVIPNNAATGRTSINVGADKVLIAERKGGTPKPHLVDQVLKQDGGMWTLRLK
jgi:hypothetical protein